MREKMEAMQHQIEEFIGTLNQELSQRAAHRPANNANSLMPVIQINSVTRASSAENPKRGGDSKRRLR